MLGKKQAGALCGYKGDAEIVLGRVKKLMIAVCFVLSACATMQDVNLLNQDVSRLQRDYLRMREDLENLKEKTTGVAREESFKVIQQSQAEIQAKLTDLSRDVQVLNGKFDENKYFTEKSLQTHATEMELIKHQITTLEGQIKEIKNRLETLDVRMREQQKSISDLQTKIIAPTEEQKGNEQHPATPADKASKYEAAYNAFMNGNFTDARKQFEAFIKKYPDDELTDNAYFWIAETYYGEEDFENAILSYEALLKKFPKSPKAPSALLKQGYSFIEIGDTKTGKLILEQVVERYPDTREAGLANKKLQGMKKKTSKR